MKDKEASDLAHQPCRKLARPQASADILGLANQAVKTTRTSEVRYRRLFDTARDGILILDADTGEIVDVNPFLVELLGLSREQFLKKKVWEIGTLRAVFSDKDTFIELQAASRFVEKFA